jgi:WD40 repeat protein
VIRPLENRLVVGDANGFVRLVSIADGHDLAAFKVDPLPLGAIAVSPDGHRVATWGTQGGRTGNAPPMIVRLWDVDKQALLDELGGGTLGFPSQNALQFSGNGQRLAMGKIANGFVVRDLAAKTETSMPSQGVVRGFVFLASPAELVSVGESLNAWNYDGAKALPWFRGHSSAVQAVAYSPDGRHLASASLDGTIRLWNSQLGTEEAVLSGPESGYLGTGFSPDGRYVYGCGFVGGIHLWDAKDQSRPLRAFPSPGFRGAQCAAFDAMHDRLAALISDTQIDIL